MRRLLYPLVFALVLFLAGSAVTLGGDIPHSGGTVPGEGAQVWLPVVGKPKVCEPTVYFRRVYEEKTSLHGHLAYLVWLSISYKEVPESASDIFSTELLAWIYVYTGEGGIYWMNDVRPGYYRPYTGEVIDNEIGTNVPFSRGRVNRWNVMVKCNDNTWSNWLGWEEFIPFKED